MAQDFFTRFQEQVEPPKPDAEATEAESEDAPKKGWLVEAHFQFLMPDLL